MQRKKKKTGSGQGAALVASGRGSRRSRRRNHASRRTPPPLALPAPPPLAPPAPPPTHQSRRAASRRQPAGPPLRPHGAEGKGEGGAMARDPDGREGEDRVQWKKVRRSVEDKVAWACVRGWKKKSTAGGGMLRSPADSALRRRVPARAPIRGNNCRVWFAWLKNG